MRIAVPSTLVLATDVYDQFLAENNLLDFAIRSTDEGEIEQRFLDSPSSGARARKPAGLSRRAALSAGGAFFQPA